MADWTVKSFDLLPIIRTTLSADLTDADHVDCIIRPQSGGVPIVNAAAEIVSINVPAGTTVVQYVWVAGDTNLPGLYNVEWETHWNDGKPETFPTLTYNTLEIKADLDGAA